MAPLEWRLEGRPGAWDLHVEGEFAGDVELHLSSSAATVTSDGQAPIIVQLPAHAAADPKRAVARRKHQKLVVSWPKLVEEQRSVKQTLEEQIRAIKEGRKQLESTFELMKSKYEEMTTLARDKLLESGAIASLKQPPPELAPCVCVAPHGLSLLDDDTKGRCLTVQRAWSTGEVLFGDSPCIALPMKFSVPGDKSEILEVWKNLTLEQRSFLEDFAANMELALDQDRARLTLNVEELAALSAEGHIAKPDTLLRFVMVDRVNSHHVGHVGCASGLFATASKISHSCQPNCSAREKGCSIEIVSLRPIVPGEQVTLSYIADEALLFADRAQRRRYLLQHHYFVCVCDRCQGPDTSRVFRCDCGGELVAQSCGGQTPEICEAPGVAEDVLEWCCTDCARTRLKGSDEWLDSRLARESSALAKWHKLQSTFGGSMRKLVYMDEFVGLRFQELRCAADCDLADSRSAQATLWAALTDLRKELQDCAPSHWLLAHAALLASGLALTEVALGNPLPFPEEEVLSGVAGFVEMGSRTCPQAGNVLRRLVDETRLLLSEMRCGTLHRRYANILGDDPAEIQLGDLD